MLLYNREARAAGLAYKGRCMLRPHPDPAVNGLIHKMWQQVCAFQTCALSPKHVPCNAGKEDGGSEEHRHVSCVWSQHQLEEGCCNAQPTANNMLEASTYQLHQVHSMLSFVA